MREEKPKSPSQHTNQSKKNRWLWPAVYSGVAVVIVGMVWGYTAFQNDETNDVANVVEEAGTGQDQPIVETNAAKEVLQYPFDEELLEQVVILQEYYDAEADEEMRESALLVFNQVYMTNDGVSISVDGQPFEVLAAMSGKVENVLIDPFKGNEVTISHADGLTTVYGSLADILVKEGDTLEQGEVLGTATSNEWNAQAGTHLHFQVHQDGVPINPRSKLAF